MSGWGDLATGDVVSTASADVSHPSPAGYCGALWHQQCRGLRARTTTSSMLAYVFSPVGIGTSLHGTMRMVGDDGGENGCFRGRECWCATGTDG